MPQLTIIRNIRIILFLAILMILLFSCDSGNVQISTAEEIKKQIDSTASSQDALRYNEGKQVFARYCNTCHYAPEKHVTDQYIFDNLFERLPAPAEDYFVSYITDSKSLKATGNKYALAVDDVWNSEYEHFFKDSLSEKDKWSLITYIKVAVKQKAYQ